MYMCMYMLDRTYCDGPYLSLTADHSLPAVTEMQSPPRPPTVPPSHHAGLYVTEDPGAVDDAAKFGSLSMQMGLGWSKSASMHTGQCPVMKYHRPLMNAILYEKIHIAKAVNAKVISLADAPKGYQNFDQGEAVKYVIDPHGVTGQTMAL